MPKARTRKRRKRKIRKGFLVFLFLAAVLIAGIVFVKVNLKAVGGSEEKMVQVQEGETLDQLVENLKEEGLIRNDLVTKVWFQTHHAAWYAGTYALDTDMDVQKLLETLANPSNAKADYVVLTVPEGTWAKEVAASISQIFPYSQEEILNKWNDIVYIKELSADYPFLSPASLANSELKVKLEGYLFPETYFLNEDATIDQITRAMLDQFAAFYNQNKQAFDDSRLNVEELVTLASIVQFEASDVQDMKTIAGVFYNRLADDMRLQSSVTVCYALYDQFNDPQDCETEYNIDSPYNTYLIQGLPPGPILNPGRDALLAALYPEDNDYYFFAADIYNVKSTPGKVYYSRTLEEHEQIVRDLNLVIE